MTDQQLAEIKARLAADLPDLETVDAATRSRIEDIAALLEELERRT
jgi:hypothetical protein